MTVPGMPVAALVLLLFAATMFASPFESARSSITPGILPGERYALGTAVLQTTYLTAEVLGAAAGGAVVTIFGVRPSLLVDAVTFVASGLLIGLGTRARPAAARPDAGQGSPLARAAAGLRLVFGDRALRTLVLLGWLIVLYTIPQGIAAPYAARLGGGPVATGLVLASTAAATAIATPLFSRFVSPRRRLALMGPLAVAAGATLVLTALHPGLAVSLVIFSAAAASGAYQLAVNTAFVVRVPDERRAQAFGIASMGVVVAQGAAFVAAGAVAEVVTPASVIAVGGGIGAVAAVALTISWRRVTAPSRLPVTRPEHGEPEYQPSGEAMTGGGAPSAGREERACLPVQLSTASLLTSHKPTRRYRNPHAAPTFNHRRWRGDARPQRTTGIRGHRGHRVRHPQALIPEPARGQRLRQLQQDGLQAQGQGVRRRHD
jgi:predicted MFS family arabinose efflux permease